MIDLFEVKGWMSRICLEEGEGFVRQMPYLLGEFLIQCPEIRAGAMDQSSVDRPAE